MPLLELMPQYLEQRSGAKARYSIFLGKFLKRLKVGVACSMAAAAAAFLIGGNPQQCELAAESALESFLGLTCCPVLGLVQVKHIFVFVLKFIGTLHRQKCCWCR